MALHLKKIIAFGLLVVSLTLTTVIVLQIREKSKHNQSMLLFDEWTVQVSFMDSRQALASFNRLLDVAGHDFFESCEPYDVVEIYSKLLGVAVWSQDWDTAIVALDQMITYDPLYAETYVSNGALLYAVSGNEKFSKYLQNSWSYLTDRVPKGDSCCLSSTLSLDKSLECFEEQHAVGSKNQLLILYFFSHLDCVRPEEELNSLKQLRISIWEFAVSREIGIYVMYRYYLLSLDVHGKSLGGGFNDVYGLIDNYFTSYEAKSRIDEAEYFYRLDRPKPIHPKDG